MQSKQEASCAEPHLYEYAVVRYVPRVEREEFMNIGLLMMCKRQRWIRVRFGIDRGRIASFAPDCDIEALETQLDAFERTARGCRSPIGELETHERFRWLTAVRSASITTSRPHPGHASDLDATFDRLFEEMVGRDDARS